MSVASQEFFGFAQQGKDDASLAFFCSCDEMRWSLAFSILLLLGILSSIGATPCTSMEVVKRKRATAEFHFQGGKVTTFPAYNGAIQGASFISWELAGLVERNKSTLKSSGESTLPKCVSPSAGNSIGLLDPLEPGNPRVNCSGSGTGATCGPVASHLWMKDMECSLEERTEPFHGFERDCIFVTFTHPQYPDFKLVSANYILNGTIDIYPIPNNTQLVNQYEYVVRNSFFSRSSASALANWH